MSNLDFDEAVSADDDTLTVIQAIQQYKREADDAKTDRISKNQQNRDVFLARQDWSHKIAGQSREFLPKVPVAVEQMAAFVKKALVSQGDWASCDTSSALANVIDGTQIMNILKVFLNNLWTANGTPATFSTVISDAVKNGLLESLMILKVHGGMVKRRMFFAEGGEMVTESSGQVKRSAKSLSVDEIDEWRLRIDLVRPEDYYPDPTGNGLYEIHTVERDLHEVISMAEQGIYDEDAVQQLIDRDYARPDDEKRLDRDRNQEEAPPPAFRKRVVLDEFWGTLLAPDGTVAHRNCVATVANDMFLIRPPEANPFWHGESPFVAVPLIRVPWSVWHKALYDDASQLNLAMNEMFNLILDGGLASVWGVRQVRLEDMEDPGQVAGGIPQGATIAVKNTLATGAKVVEQVTEGEVPSDAMAVFEFLNREFNAAALTNEIKLGGLPGKDVLATEVIEASQSQAVTLDGLVVDVERELMVSVLYKSWLTVLQNADDIPDSTLTNTADARAAMLIMRADPAERFSLFAGRLKFRVNGLSGTINRAREFQKIMAMMQAVTSNPLLFQAFLQKFSPDRTLASMMKALNLNPDDIKMTPEELAQLPQTMANLPMMNELLGGGSPGSQGGRRKGMNGEPGMASGVNQLARPVTGMTANG